MGGFADFFDDSDDELVANVIEVPAQPPPPAPQPAPLPQPPPSALTPPPAAVPKSLHEILRLAREKEQERERAREREKEVAPSANRKGKRPAAPALPTVAAPAAAAPAAAAAASKRPRVSAGEGTLVIRDDSSLPEADAAEWRNRVGELTRAGEQWVDESFPACQLSIRGKEEEAAPPPPRAPAPLVPGVPPTCQCDVPAAAAKVTKDTPNKDREYWHCKARKCGFWLGLGLGLGVRVRASELQVANPNPNPNLRRASVASSVGPTAATRPSSGAAPPPSSAGRGCRSSSTWSPTSASERKTCGRHTHAATLCGITLQPGSCLTLTLTPTPQP